MQTLQRDRPVKGSGKHALGKPRRRWVPVLVLALAAVVVAIASYVVPLVIVVLADSSANSLPAGWTLFLGSEGETLRHYYPVLVVSIRPASATSSTVGVKVDVHGDLGTSESMTCESYAGNPKPVYGLDVGIIGNAYHYGYPVDPGLPRTDEVMWRIEPRQVRTVTFTMGLQAHRAPIVVGASNTSIVCYAERDVDGMLPQ